MSRPTKLQIRKMREMVEGKAGPRRAISSDIPLRTIEAMLRAGWIREVDGTTIEITPAGVRAYPVPMTRSKSLREYRNADTGVRLVRGARGWTTKVAHQHEAVNCDHYFDVALQQAQAMASMILFKRVRGADLRTAAQWESGR